jgi:hypothetical protein
MVVVGVVLMVPTPELTVGKRWTNSVTDVVQKMLVGYVAGRAVA